MPVEQVAQVAVVLQSVMVLAELAQLVKVATAAQEQTAAYMVLVVAVEKLP
jgi:hypothetical protein